MYKGEKIKFLHKHEKKRLFQVIAADTSIHHTRNKAIFFLAEYCALRASEVSHLKVSEICLENREIYIQRLKNSNCCTLRIVDDTVFKAITNYMSYRVQNDIDSEYLFLSQKGNPISRKTLDDLMKHYCNMAGIPREKAHFHALRHTRAIELADMGCGTKDVKYWLGHKRIQNTELYLQFTTKQQEALYRMIEASMYHERENSYLSY